MSSFPTFRELIANVKPARSTPRTISAANWSLGAAVVFSLVTIACGGIVTFQPALKLNLQPIAFTAYLISLCLLTLWSGLNLVTLITVLWKSDAMFADQLDAQIAQDRVLIESLVSSNTLCDVQRLGRQITFEAKMIEGFGGTVTRIGGVAAAVAAAATSLPVVSSQVGDTLKIIIPALLLGIIFAGALKHSFGQRLLRLGFVISEVERELFKKEEATSSLDNNGA